MRHDNLQHFYDVEKSFLVALFMPSYATYHLSQNVIKHHTICGNVITTCNSLQQHLFHPFRASFFDLQRTFGDAVTGAVGI